MTNPKRYSVRDYARFICISLGLFIIFVAGISGIMFAPVLFGLQVVWLLHFACLWSCLMTYILWFLCSPSNIEKNETNIVYPAADALAV